MLRPGYVNHAQLLALFGVQYLSNQCLISARLSQLYTVHFYNSVNSDSVCEGRDTLFMFIALQAIAIHSKWARETIPTNRIYMQLLGESTDISVGST